MFERLPIEVEAPPTDSAPSTPAPPPLDPAVAETMAREWADCSGAILAKLIADAMAGVADLPDDLAGDQAIFDLITANARLAAWATANQAWLTALVHGRARAEHAAIGLVRRDGAGTAAGPSHGYDDDRYTSAEIAANLSLELGLSMPVAEREVTFGLGLARDEDLRRALAGGRLDTAQARAVVDELDHVLDPDVRVPVVAALVTDPQVPGAHEILVRELQPGRKRLWELPPAQLRAIVRREITRREPDQAEVQLAVTRASRHLRFVPRRDAMADLVLHGPAETLAAAYQQVSLAAHAVKQQAGTHPDVADLGLDEIRHDLALGRLTQGTHGLSIPAPGSGRLPQQRGGVSVREGPTVAVNITVADTTLLGLDELPGTLHSPAGPMPIPADLARRLAYDEDQATWRRVLCDPRTGAAVDVSRSYRPAPRIAEFVKVRDGFRSRFPGSNATHLELDHVVNYTPESSSGGGQTTASNLRAAGRQDHHLKTDGAISVTGDANGPLTYRGRSGHDHVSSPHLYLDPPSAPRREPDRAPDLDRAPDPDPPAAGEHRPTDGSDPPF